MAQIEFTYNGINTIIQCLLNEKLKNIIQRFKDKVEINNNKNLIYTYDGKIGINENLTFVELYFFAYCFYSLTPLKIYQIFLLSKEGNKESKSPPYPPSHLPPAL